ncbi:MAG: response regulator [Anaerolineales bacterium]|nr:response regulator [Anaerolineales bacterium]
MPVKSLILIVDDEPIARETLAGLLQTSGYDLAFAVDGPDGLAQARALRPDVILLDVMMPGLDGLEVCRRLRADPHLAEVPVFFITALDDRATRLAGLQAGADDFLAKPFDSLELQARLQTVTRLNRYRRLLAERARFEWLVAQAAEGFVALDAAGAIQYANPQARLYLSLDREQLGADFLETARRQYRCEPEVVWAEWERHQTLPAPAYLIRPETITARAFWLAVDRLPASPAGDAGGTLRLRDVTSQVHNEHETRVFHGVIMHKLRTPLVPMVGGLELIQQLAPTSSPDELASLAGMALTGVRRLQAEIDDILGYVRAPGLAQSGETLQLADWPARVRAAAADLGLGEIQVTVAPDLAADYLALSPQAMDIILWELLENARKFHPAGAPAVVISLTSSGAGWARLQVQDDGVTLSPEQMAWAWRPYLQGEKSFTGETPGMGLGLPRVAALIWQVGGQARLFNRPDRPGVVVELTVPVIGAGRLD